MSKAIEGNILARLNRLSVNADKAQDAADAMRLSQACQNLVNARHTLMQTRFQQEAQERAQEGQFLSDRAKQHLRTYLLSNESHIAADVEDYGRLYDVFNDVFAREPAK